MVGARGASFLKEGYSMQYASSVVEKVWNTAAAGGFADDGGSAVSSESICVRSDH